MYIYKYTLVSQVYLAPSPSTAKCLTSEERIGLQKRQDDAIAARHAASGHSTVKGESTATRALLTQT